MSTIHDTKYPVWPECMDEHTNPDDDEQYACDSGNTSCLSTPLATWPSPAVWQTGRVLCEICSRFEAAMQEYETTHGYGEDADGTDLTICMVGEPTTYCRECSDEQGEWVQHHDDEEDEK